MRRLFIVSVRGAPARDATRRDRPSRARGARAVAPAAAASPVGRARGARRDASVLAHRALAPPRMAVQLANSTSGAFYTLVPIRPRSRGERLSLRTFAGVPLRPPLAFNPRPRCISTPPDAYELHPDVRSYRTPLTRADSPPPRRRRATAATATATTRRPHQSRRDPSPGGSRGGGTPRSPLARRTTHTTRKESRSGGRDRGARLRCVLYTGPHTTAFAL
jgi:hypothetical protein